jgi:uroporphyrinogen decarboxylase
MQRIAEIQKTIYLEGLDRIGKYLALIRLGGEDFGTQQGLLISPMMFRTMVKPILKEVYAAIKERLADLGNYDCKLMLHTCGSITRLIDDYIEIGVDVLDPVQTRAKGMNGLYLKQTFGDRISFHGGIDTQGVLPFGSEEEVVEETKCKIEMLASGGGYILCPTHNVQADVVGRKLIAMVETAVEHGRYPIPQTYDQEMLLNRDY